MAGLALAPAADPPQWEITAARALSLRPDQSAIHPRGTAAWSASRARFLGWSSGPSLIFHRNGFDAAGQVVETRSALSNRHGRPGGLVVGTAQGIPAGCVALITGAALPALCRHELLGRLRRPVGVYQIRADKYHRKFLSNPGHIPKIYFGGAS